MWLFWPFPWKFLLPPPFSPHEIRAHPEIVTERHFELEDYEQLREIRLFQVRDTPLRSLYRLYELLCADLPSDSMLESHYFWRTPTWRMGDIPNPNDPDPVRQTILASLVEEMVTAYNWKIGLGMRRGVKFHSKRDRLASANAINKPFETCPEWATQPSPLPGHLSFLQDGKRAKRSSHFTKRNISLDCHQLWSV